MSGGDRYKSHQIIAKLTEQIQTHKRKYVSYFICTKGEYDEPLVPSKNVNKHI